MPLQFPDPALTETTPHKLAFLVYGTPAPQGSKRHVGNGVMIENNKEALTTWREDVKLAALRALDIATGWERDYRCVVAHMVFTLPRPQNHYRTGKFAHLLKDDAPRLHGVKPDLDKLLRSTGDALTAAGVYRDDCRLAQVFAVKVYPSSTGYPPGALDRPGARLVLTGVDR